MSELIPEDIKDVSLTLAEANKNALVESLPEMACFMFYPDMAETANISFMPRKAQKINGLFDCLSDFGTNTTALNDFTNELLKGLD